MSTPKHTPGPWTARKAPERNAYAWDVEGAQGTVPTIARMALVDRASEVEANAHLIAAAPAMYLELKESLVLLRASYHDMCEKHGADSLHAQVLFERIESVWATLAQAEGRQA